MNCPVNGSDFIFSMSCAIHRDFLVLMLRFLQSLSEVGSSILMFSSGVFSIFGSSTLSEISTVLLRTITTSFPSLAFAVNTFSSWDFSDLNISEKSSFFTFRILFGLSLPNCPFFVSRWRIICSSVSSIIAQYPTAFAGNL